MRSQKSLQVAFDQLFQAIDICTAQRLRTPALILIYSLIDIASWLHSDSPRVKARFTEWVDKYLLPGSPLKCNALDLYGARCGVVHSYSPDSDLSIAGRVTPIAYAWAPSRVTELERLVEFGVMLKLDYLIAVQVEDLIQSLRTGVNQFLGELETDSIRAKATYTKAAKFFMDLSAEATAEMLRQAESVLSKP